MPSNSIFWKIQRGEIAPPKIATALNAITTQFNEAEKTLETTFTIEPRFTNPAGHVQGGIITAMLDATMGPCNGMVLDDNQFAPTLNINVAFINPALPGKFTGKARVVRQGLTICFLEGQIFDANNRLIATATATAKVVTLENKQLL